MQKGIFDGIPDKDEMDRHYAAMRGGDNQMSYTETGDFVIPPEVQEANPALMMAAMEVFRGMGVDPNMYVSGSSEGNYNPTTGVQEFGWIDDLYQSAKTNAYDYSKKSLDYLSNSDFGKAAASAALTAGAAKLTGSDTSQALAAGAGAGLGYYAGNQFDTGLNNLANEKSFFKEKPETNYTSQNLGEAFKNVADSTNFKALSSAGLGAFQGYQMSAPIPDFPDLQLKTPDKLNLAPLANENPFNTFDDNERANLTATLPQNLPVGPMTPRALASVGGVTYKKKVKDRDTGRFSYVDADNNDAGSFSRSLNQKSRRKGFGGGLIFV
tara:strand:- start:4866 stop:5840 length:975 start_codon:yes stop_codon:yes gene_type:complete